MSVHTGNLTVRIEHKDGHYCFFTGVVDLYEAQEIITNEALCVRENCSDDDAKKWFPLIWTIRSEGKSQMDCIGLINEHGGIYGVEWINKTRF